MYYKYHFRKATRQVLNVCIIKKNYEAFKMCQLVNCLWPKHEGLSNAL